MALRRDDKPQGFNQPRPNQPQAQQTSDGQVRLGTPGSAEVAIQQLEDRAMQAIEGLQSADAHFAAEVLAEKQSQFEHATDAIGEVLSFYDDPEAKIMVGLLKSAEKVNVRRGVGKSRLSRTLTGYTFPSATLTPVSSFSRFYSDSLRSDAPQLAGSNSKSTSNSESNSIDPLESNN